MGGRGGEVLRLRRAGSAGGREGEEAIPGPGEWRNLTVGGSEEAAAGKWRRRQQHNETRPVVGGSAGLGPVRAGRRWRPRRACPRRGGCMAAGHGCRSPAPAPARALPRRGRAAPPGGGMAAGAASPPSGRWPRLVLPRLRPSRRPRGRPAAPAAASTDLRHRPQQLPAAGRARAPRVGWRQGPAGAAAALRPLSAGFVSSLRAPRAAALGACRRARLRARALPSPGCGFPERLCRVAWRGLGRGVQGSKRVSTLRCYG
ncbi:uncharacterized protein C10orf95-like [Struthio camelus]|uniref:uncharacterized protein C10orf95-like n=1 Tax=Struthio camelus TaxID=8801 RepID=UPI003603E036